MDFGEALKSLKNGEKICRKSWNSYYVCLKNDEFVAYDIFLGVPKRRQTFAFSHADILANDWKVIIEPPRVGDIVKTISGKKGIVLKTHLDGNYSVLLDNGITALYNFYELKTIGENYKELVDNLLDVLSQGE